MSCQKKVYVTTSIPYVNSRPHVGHALELIQADVIARHYRLAGHDVRFQTGTDENAFKNVLAAKAQGLSTQELVTRNAATFRSLVERLDISADDFIRTTEDRHRRGVIESGTGSGWKTCTLAPTWAFTVLVAKTFISNETWSMDVVRITG